VQKYTFFIIWQVFRKKNIFFFLTHFRFPFFGRAKVNYYLSLANIFTQKIQKLTPFFNVLIFLIFKTLVLCRLLNRKILYKGKLFSKSPSIAPIETAALAANKQEYKRKQELTLQKKHQDSLLKKIV
jgi:hypothetical protein